MTVLRPVPGCCRDSVDRHRRQGAVEVEAGEEAAGPASVLPSSFSFSPFPDAHRLHQGVEGQRGEKGAP